MDDKRSQANSEAGQLVRTLIDGMKEPGKHLVLWDGRSDRGERLSSRSYFYQIDAGGVSSAKKLVLLK
jgi:flagellar hook assembly protein FlgD